MPQLSTPLHRLPTDSPSRRLEGRRTLNVRLLIATLGLLAVSVPTVYLWHGRQLDRVSEALLQRASQLEQSGDDEQAVHYLYRCLQLTTRQPELQRDLLARLARSYDRSEILSADKATVIQWYYRAVGAAPDDLELQQRLAELFLETRQFMLAEEQAKTLLQKEPALPAARRIRALAKYGQLRRGRPVLPQQVRSDLQDAQRRNPDDVPIAEALAYVYREATPPSDQLDPITRADATMDALVRNAPNDYRAYLARHHYRVTYQLVPDARDMQRAMELAPDEPEVVLAAAEDAQRSGQLDQSISQFERLIELDPQEFRGYLGLGESRYRNGQLSEALAAWRRGLSDAARGRLPLRVRLIEGLIEDEQLAAAEAQLGELDSAIRYLATNDGENQRDWVVAARDLLWAKLRMARGEYRQALPLLQRVATTAKADRSQAAEAAPAYQAWLLMGQAQLQLQEWEGAATSFQRALQIVPRSIPARLWAARAWSAVGRDDQALVLCEQAAGRPNTPDNVWLMLAQLHLRTQMRLPPKQRDWQRLELVLQQAAAALPDSWEIPLVRANLLILRDTEAGIGQAMQILLAEENAHPRSIPLWSNLIFLYERMGLPGEANRALQRLQQLQPESAQTTAWQVALLAARGDFADAQAVLEQSPARSDPEANEWIDRARILLAYQKGDLEQIREVLLEIQAQRPEGTQVLAQLADLALADGNLVESDRWITRLRAAEGADGVWWRFFQARRLLAGRGDGHSDVLAQVTTLYDQIRRLRPWWPGVAMLRGLLAESEGVWAEATEAYVSAIRSGFHQPHVYERLIGLLYQQGRFEEANQWLDQLQQQAPLDVRILDLAWSTAVQRGQSELAIRLARQNLLRHPDSPSAQIWLAQMLVMTGQRSEAESLIEAAQQTNPQDLASWTGLLAYHLRVGNTQHARDCLQHLQRHPDLSSVQFHALAGYAFQMLGDRAQAEQHYGEAIRLSPDNTELRLQFARFLHPLDPVRAEAELRDAVRRAPDHVDARHTLAAWLHGRDDDEAQQEARELLYRRDASRRSQASDRRLEAVLLMRRGRPADLQAALVLLEQLVNDPRQVTAEDRSLLGRLYERSGNLAAAEEQWLSLADAEPVSARNVAIYVDFLLRRQRLDEARRYLEKLERLAPIGLTTVTLRSRLLLQTGQGEQIEAYVEAFAQKQLADLQDPQQRQQFMRQIAGTYANLNRDTSAERWYRRLVAEFPAQREALAGFWLERNRVPQSLEFALSELQEEISPATATLLAQVMIKGDLDPDQVAHAEAIFGDVLGQHPEDPQLLFALASLRIKQQRLDEAVQLLRELTELHPEHVTAWNNLAAILADDPQHLNEALRCIDRALAAAGQPVPNLLDTKAVILLQQNRNLEAAQLMQQVLSLAAERDPRFHFHFAVVQQRLGEPLQAKQAWMRAKELGLFEAYLTGFERQLANELGKLFDESAADSANRIAR